jgi:multidrug resistance efflux pump
LEFGSLLMIKKLIMKREEIIEEEKNTNLLESGSSPLNSRSLGRAFKHRSDATQEIISLKPAFIEKWALLLFMCISLLLIGGTWLIRYPDIIEARGTLTADNAPKEIISFQTGRLIKLFVKNGEPVKKGEMIGWLESTANTQEVLNLCAKLDSSLLLIETGGAENIANIYKMTYRSLGDLQIPYQTFNTALQQYNDYLVNGFYVRKKEMLQKDISTLQQINSSIETQKKLTLQDEDSSQKTLAMNKILFDQKVISAEEYRVATSKHTNKQMALPQLNANILGNQNQQRDKLKEIEQLNHDLNQQKIIFEQALQTLKSSVDDWIHKYILQAPVDGIIFFTLPLQQNKFIEQGKLLGYINPPHSKYYVEISLPQNNFGKVDTGMQVQLRFDAYPYQEVGFVKGKLDYISPIATDTGFLATIQLDKGLVTNLDNHIQYKNGLKAQALVITKNMRLFQRLYYNMVKATSPGK